MLGLALHALLACGCSSSPTPSIQHCSCLRHASQDPQGKRSSHLANSVVPYMQIRPCALSCQPPVAVPCCAGVQGDPPASRCCAAAGNGGRHRCAEKQAQTCAVIAFQ